MPERPLLILPAPGAPVNWRKKGGGGARFHRPGRERQAERLVPQFQRLQRAFQDRRARLQTDAHGLVPEEVIVLETIGTVDGFIRAVERIPGMEWLAEVEDEDIPPDDDFFAINRKGEAREGQRLSGRVFMIFARQDALQQMLSLWNTWQASQDLPRGLGRWRLLFEQLRAVRPWGVHDRLIETGVLDDWRERVKHGEDVVPCEIELWYRKTPQQRRAARERVKALVEEQAGRVVESACIDEVAYDGLLAYLPAGRIAHLIENPAEDTALVQCEQVQFFRATGQMSTVSPDGERSEDREPVPIESPTGNPVVALLDGLPLQNHRRLTGRLIVDDPDDFEANYPAEERRHGTAMASLILHGDLGAPARPLQRPLYVRPILKPDSKDWNSPRREAVPENALVVDMIHRAVRRLFDRAADAQPVAPEVVVINLSIGIQDRPFDRSMSPLARLLDWLSWRYQVLFVVSAGNHAKRIELALPRDSLPWPPPSDFCQHVIRAVAADARHRRLLSPAESVNAITVAALHADSSTGDPPPNWVDVYEGKPLPSPINAQGMGYRRAIKPDVLAPGGRIVVQKTLETTECAMLDVYAGTLAPGQLVAAPGRLPGERAGTWYTRGTSNATALVSRAAGLLYDVLQDLRDEPGGELIDEVPRAIWLKAMIAHTANWGRAGEILDRVLRNTENTRKFREYITRLLGYGSTDIDRVRECTAQRVTAISGGRLKTGQSHVHRFPLPASLSGRRGFRRLTITLGWLTPVNPRHQGWRRAALWFAPPRAPLRVRRYQADWQAVQRGTLQHEILEGDEASVFAQGSQLEIQVSCRADAGTLEEEVPYALVTTLEVAEELGIEIYEEVRTAVRAQVVIRPPT